jgi:glutamyl-Q tRNA(Asp) synthetase
MGGYRGRFSPSPTGPLHAGSLVAALASWLDARAHSGVWLIRIEDVDTPRCVSGSDAIILSQLTRCGLVPDEVVQWQSKRQVFYQAALNHLLDSRTAYPCACSRADIAQAMAGFGQSKARHTELVYPGTCRAGLQGRHARAVRCNTLSEQGRDLNLAWVDRRLGSQFQNLTQRVGDFVLKRADGLWAYQLAVVVDDAQQGITHVVRGEDLADSTPRQIHLQQQLGLPALRYLHTPLVMGADGEKLSKQNGAQPLVLHDPLTALNAAAAVLGLVGLRALSLSDWLAQAVRAWELQYKEQ